MPTQVSATRTQRTFRVVNWFMLRLWRLRLGWLVNLWPAVGGRIMVLTHTGRSTGLRRQTPVSYALVDGDVWCTTMPAATWYRNMVANPEVEVWLPRERWTGTAHLVPLDAASVPMLRQVLVSSGFAARAFGGVDPRRATDRELLAACAGYHLIHIRLSGADRDT